MTDKQDDLATDAKTDDAPDSSAEKDASTYQTVEQLIKKAATGTVEQMIKTAAAVTVEQMIEAVATRSGEKKSEEVTDATVEQTTDEFTEEDVDDPPCEEDVINVGAIATIGLVSIGLTLATVFAVFALYFNQIEAEYDRKVIQAIPVVSESRVAEQEAKLARYGWKDKVQGAVLIPIEEAMEIVVAQYRRDDVEGTGAVPEESK